MNPIILRELEKCKVELPVYNDNSTKIVILKQSKDKPKLVDMEIGKYYIIKVARYILFPPENFTLDSNWNNGVRAKSEYMLVTPVKFAGKMTCIDGCGYDYADKKPLDDVYNGFWLPGKGFEILEEFKG